jgi:hypothetical protein
MIVGAVEIHRIAAFAGNARRATDQRAVPTAQGGVGRRGAAGFVEQEQGLQSASAVCETWKRG